MALVARASKTVRNKNCIIVVMCAVFVGWFAYDGYYNWPTRNDRAVAIVRARSASPEHQLTAQAWHGWEQETDEHHREMDEIINAEKATLPVEGLWKNSFDIHLQRWIVWGLLVATGASVWWFVRCQRRRVIAEASTVSPAPGVTIPWDKIKVVDNTRWKSAGIVDITYVDEKGSDRKSKFDDYEVDREPLLQILDQLSEKAVNAEFIPREEPAPAAPSEGSPEDKKD